MNHRLADATRVHAAAPTPQVASGHAIPALSAAGISKAFGAVQALHEASLTVNAGEILGLVGANGAGKSTLIRILTGDLVPDDGEIQVHGESRTLGSVRDAMRLGIGVVRQELDLVPELSIAENLFLGEEASYGGGRWLIRREVLEEAARPLLAAVGLTLTPARHVRSLSIGDRQLVAAARALRDAAAVLLLDEPTSSLTPWETERLFATIRGLAERGVAVVYISHRLEEVTALCHRVTVLRDGNNGGDFGEPGMQLDDIVAAMTPGLGKAQHRRSGAQMGEVALEVRELRVGRHGPASFAVRRGEIVGIFGLVGAGRSTVARALTGLIRPDAGEILLGGRAVDIRSPWHGFRRGIAYLAEDRKTESILPGLSVRLNIGVRAPAGTSHMGILSSNGLRRLARRMIERLGIRAPSDQAHIEELSGGNQQKTVIGRLLAEELNVVVLDEPTHGIDVRAKRELLELMHELARDGLAIVLISSELAELMTSTDRILVFRRGRVVAEFASGEATESELVGAAAGRAVAA